MSLYAAFDLYPSAKGAATHIYQMAGTLFKLSGGGVLHCLGHEGLPRHQDEDGVRIHRFISRIPNYLARAQAYSQHLHALLEDYPEIEFCHFRDIWSGLPILGKKRYKTLFEVNGLPSIELPYRYPDISHHTLDKIAQLELHCLKESDHLLTPSFTTKKYICNLGISEEKITVIPNGAEIPVLTEQESPLSSPYIIYFGALQSWQGVDVLLKGFAGLKDFTDLKLVICSSSRKRFIKAYRKLAEKMEIGERVLWNYQLSKDDLNRWINHALFSVAPLKETARNVQQGCSPLKVFESLACQTAVVASDLPPVREILDADVHGKLVRPDRPAVLSRAMRFLLENEDERQRLAKNGFERVMEKYLWATQKEDLVRLYQKIM